MTITEVETDQALQQIGQILKWLDLTEKKMDIMVGETSALSPIKWFAEKKAITEIKKVMFTIGKYEYYDEYELNNFKNYLQRIAM